MNRLLNFRILKTLRTKQHHNKRGIQQLRDTLNLHQYIVSGKCYIFQHINIYMLSTNLPLHTTSELKRFITAKSELGTQIRNPFSSLVTNPRPLKTLIKVQRVEYDILLEISMLFDVEFSNEDTQEKDQCFEKWFLDLGSSDESFNSEARIATPHKSWRTV